MRSICMYFQVHQPVQLRKYRFFDIGDSNYYYDDYQNKHTVKRLSENCYIPANEIIKALIAQYPERFNVAFSMSGVAVEQFQKYAPEVIESFKELAQTGNVEFLSETYAQSLLSLGDISEFERQVKAHSSLIKEVFGQQPVTFRNTELIYSNNIAEKVQEMGFKNMITEGAKQTLGWKSPNHVYKSSVAPELNLLLRNYRLSDDISFRFSQQNWSEWPLTAEKYVEWINNSDENEPILNLFMDYESFGEYNKEDSGIFEFLRSFPEMLIDTGKWEFGKPSRITEVHKAVGEIDVPYVISWADEEKDITAWLGNDMQQQVFQSLNKVAPIMATCTDKILLRDWNYLQASDNFYFMSTKWFSHVAVQHYRNPYASPYEAFLNYMNIISDFLIRVKEYAENTVKA